MKRHFANMVFALILIAYTVYAALDTFVIVRVLTPDTLPTPTAEASTAPTEAPTTVPTATEPPAEQAATVPISTDTEYHDDQIDIVLTTMRVENTTVYVADVQLADISLLKTALAGNTYARNLTETTSTRARFSPSTATITAHRSAGMCCATACCTAHRRKAARTHWSSVRTAISASSPRAKRVPTCWCVKARGRC